MYLKNNPHQDCWIYSNRAILQISIRYWKGLFDLCANRILTFQKGKINCLHFTTIKYFFKITTKIQLSKYVKED